MKTCKRCKNDRRPQDFAKCASSPDNLQRWCRQCWKTYDYNRCQDTARKNKDSKRKKTTECKYTEKDYREKNQKKRSAHQAVAQALKKRHLVKECCMECGESHTYAHHCDYDRPLDVMWLCATHHAEWHFNNGEGVNA